MKKTSAHHSSEDDPHQATSSSSKLKPYSPPRITHYGSVTSATGSNSAGSTFDVMFGTNNGMPGMGMGMGMGMGGMGMGGM
ncbi:MAG: hypothetical protein L3J39_01455 [Verrucomicrobiales bacterium]|nr:hypothetical protein [Verrucomicrobiales bacterium]